MKIVTLQVAKLNEVKRRAQAAFKGKRQARASVLPHRSFCFGS